MTDLGERPLGTFDPAVAEVLAASLEQQGVPHRVVAVTAGHVVIVRDALVDAMRARLVQEWPGVLARVDVEASQALAGSPMPGWIDPPQDVWVDRDGRLRVAPDSDTEEQAEADRSWGPSLLGGGAILLLLAWYGGLGPGAVVLGVSLVLIGAMLPR